MSSMPSSPTSLAAERRWMFLASRVHDDNYRDLVISSESEDRDGDSSPGRASVKRLLLASDGDVPEESLGVHHTLAVEGRPRSSFLHMGSNELSISEPSETSSTGERGSWEEVDVPSPADMRDLNGGRLYHGQARSYHTSFGIAVGELWGNDSGNESEGSRTGGSAIPCQREFSNASGAGTASGDARDTEDARDTRDRGEAALATSPDRPMSRQPEQSAEDGYLDFARPALPAGATDGTNLSEIQWISSQVPDTFVRDRDAIVAVLLVGVMLGMAIPESARALCSLVCGLAMVQVITDVVVTVTATARLREKGVDVLGEDSIAQYHSEADSSITLLAELPPDGSLSQEDIAETDADRSSILTDLGQELRDSMRSLMRRVSSKSFGALSLALPKDDHDERPLETEIDDNTDGDAGAGGTVGQSLDAPNRLDSTTLQKEVIAFLPQAHRDLLASAGDAEQAKLVRQCLAYANGELDLARKVCARFSKFRVENEWDLVLTADELEVPLRSMVHTLLQSRDSSGTPSVLLRDEKA